jgi:hypothetical protein
VTAHLSIRCGRACVMLSSQIGAKIEVAPSCPIFMTDDPQAAAQTTSSPLADALIVALDVAAGSPAVDRRVEERDWPNRAVVVAGTPAGDHAGR